MFDDNLNEKLKLNPSLFLEYCEEYCEQKRQESKIQLDKHSVTALNELKELFPNNKFDDPWIDINNYIDPKFIHLNEITPRDKSYVTYMLLWNINGFYSHSGQFNQIFEEEKPSLVIINEHNVDSNAQCIIDQMNVCAKGETFVASRLPNCKHIHIPYGCCMQNFDPHINKTIYNIGFYSKPNEIKLLPNRLSKILKIIMKDDSVDAKK